MPRIFVKYEDSGLEEGRGDLTSFTRAISSKALRASRWPRAFLTVLYCSEERMRELNATYRNVNESTDVLSFPTTDNPRAIAAETEPYLGDIAIALPYVARQAEREGRHLGDELALLLIHGLLHLLGHDHDTPARKKLMWSEQSVLLERTGQVPRPQIALREGPQ